MSKKIIIIFWGHPLFDGRCMNMMNQFLEQKYDVNILGVGSKSETINYKNVEIELIDSHALENSLTKYFKYFKYVKNYIIKKDADVIIASDLYSMIPCAQNKKKHTARIIYDSREIYSELGGLVKKPLIQKIWSWYEYLCIYKVDKILVTAEIDKVYLEKLYKYPNIKVVKNLPGLSFTRNQNHSLKQSLCLNPDVKILLYQGKFHEGRGIRFTMKCIQNIQKSVLVLIGDGPMKNNYIKESKKYNMADRLFFIDVTPYEKLADFSRDAFIGLSIIQPISKSYEHALPNKLFEYAVSGLPVICSNLIAMKEMINQYNSGISIPYNSEYEFKKAYENILLNYDNYILNNEKKLELLWDNQNQHLLDIVNE